MEYRTQKSISCLYKCWLLQILVWNQWSKENTYYCCIFPSCPFCVSALCTAVCLSMSFFLLLICIKENCLDFFLCFWSVVRPDYFCLEKENLRVKNLYYMRFAENRFHISLDPAKYANAEKTCLTINSCAYRDHVCLKPDVRMQGRILNENL